MEQILSIKLQLAASIKLNRVELIKHIRALCGLSLKDAADTADSLLKGNGWNILHPQLSLIHQINAQNIFKIVDKEHPIDEWNERITASVHDLIKRGAEGDPNAAIEACKIIQANPGYAAPFA